MKSNLIIILIFLVALSKTTLFSFYGFGLVDEGESLHNARRILTGDIPYRDFFAIFPPMDNYFYALIFKFFGESVQVPRIISSVIFSFTPVLIFLICKRFASTKLSTIPATLITFLDVNIERLFLMTFIFLGLYLFLQAVDQKNKWLFSCSGSVLGLSSLFRLDIPGTFGVAAIVVLPIHLFLVSRQDWIRRWFVYSLFMGIGFGLPLLAIVLWTVNLGIFGAFINQVFMGAITITRLHHLSFPSILDLIPLRFDLATVSNTFTAYYGYAIIATYLVSILLVLKKTAVIIKNNIEIPILTLAGILALPYVFGRSDMGHFVKGGMPFLVLGVFLLKNTRNFKTRIILHGLIIGLFVAAISQSVWWIHFNDHKIQIVDQTFNLNSKYPANSTKPSAESLKRSATFLRENSTSTESVLVLPYMAGLYFLSHRSSPTQFNNLLAGFITTEEEQLEFIDKIEKNNVKVVVYDPNNGPKMRTPKMQNYNQTIDRYLFEKFKIVEETPEGWLFMKKKI